MRLFIFGMGYVATRLVQLFGSEFSQISATRRRGWEPDREVEALVFADAQTDPLITRRVAEADVIISSIPPSHDGDPVISAFGDTLQAGRHRAVYLSTIGVYGDHGGAWVDEASPARANLDRTQRRLDAEDAWKNIMHGRAAMLRLGGIYGPGRNVMTSLREGKARRIVKPGRVSNRIHVDDAAQAVMAAIRHEAVGIFNVCDDEPSPPQDVIVYAAKLMKIAAPPEEAFDTAEMTEMARSFYAGNIRISNRRLKERLGVRLAYPDYRSGLDAIFAKGG
jgi:nucleoside-diphosphate-sugar epimerase